MYAQRRTTSVIFDACLFPPRYYLIRIVIPFALVFFLSHKRLSFPFINTKMQR